MTTNELTLEKCIANDRPAHPPVPTPEMLARSDNVETLGFPPQTRLLLDGFDPEEITADFLIGIHDLADEHDIPVESISVRRSM